MPLVGSLSKLNQSARLTRTEEFSSWDRVSGAFLTTTWNGRLFVSDRFKSIYHRPTRRETLSVDNDLALPSSRIIRQNSTGRVFALSTTNMEDSANQRPYDRFVAAHKVTQGELLEDQVTGTGDNLGAVSTVSKGVLFADLELRTEETLPETHRKVDGNYFLTTPADSAQPLSQGMWVILNGTTYRVREVYTEAGFQMARVESRADNREAMTYKLPAGAASYDPVTGVFTLPTSDRIFSGTVTTTSTSREDMINTGQDLTVYVDKIHVGFAFSLDQVVIRAGDTYRIQEISVGADDLQWVLSLRRG